MNSRPLIAHPQVCSSFGGAHHIVVVFDLFRQKNQLFLPQITEMRMLRVNNVPSSTNQCSGLTHNVQIFSTEEGELQSTSNCVVSTFTRNTAFDPMLRHK